MLKKTLYLLAAGCFLVGLACVLSARAQTPLRNAPDPRYTADGKMEFPAGYREWIFLSSGIDMSYNPRTAAMNHSMFDNVFVNPEAYKRFLETGTWPDKTVMVLEVRGAETKASINHAGHFQSGDVMGVEVHVKDVKRFDGGWAFFGFDGNKPAAMVPKKASCYSCHAESGAVDTTFVQFYPTLLEVAKTKQTLSAGYLKEATEKTK